TYYIRVADYQSSGRAGNFYRIKVGQFSIVTGAYPLGVQLGKRGSIALEGYALAAPKIDIKGDLTTESEDSITLRPNHSFNKLKLVIGHEPEVESTGAGQSVQVPVTINGRIGGDNSYRFRARKGEKLVIEVNARRLGSELDSIVEVLDASGKPIE